eukprot:s699_g20.t3
MPSTQSVLYVASAMISEFAAVDLANLARTPAKAEASGPIMLELLRSRTTVLMVELTPAPLAKMAWAFGRLEMRGVAVQELDRAKLSLMHSHPRHRRCAVGPNRTQQIWLGRMARWHFRTDLRSFLVFGRPGTIAWHAYRCMGDFVPQGLANLVHDSPLIPMSCVHSTEFIQCDLELCHPSLPARAVHGCLVAGPAGPEVFAERFVQHCPSCWQAAARQQSLDAVRLPQGLGVNHRL